MKPIPLGYRLPEMNAVGPYCRHDPTGFDRHICPWPVVWAVTTAAGVLGFCEQHARFYLDQGQGVYPAHRRTG